MLFNGRTVEPSIAQKNERTNVQNRQAARGGLYSPKAVAKAIGVSESSLKRWVDAGKIAATKTAGGHRRLQRSEVISFLRGRKKYELLDPVSIGLPDLSGVAVANLEEAADRYHESLISENETSCHRLLTYLYVNGWPMEEIADQVIGEAFSKIGVQWQHGKLEIYQERRAVEICLSGLHQLKSILVTPQPMALSAIGGTIENDHYSICPKAIEVVLVSHGWQATSMGTNLPFSTLLKSALTKRPNLMWLGANHIDDEDSFTRDFNEMAEQIPKSTTLVIGGRAIKPLTARIQNAIFCDSITQMVETVTRVQSRTISPASPSI